MCAGCLEEYDAEDRPYPADDLGLKADIRRLYQRHASGGPLHTMIDDMNLDDHWFTEDAWELKHYDEVDEDPEMCLAECEFIRDRLHTFDVADRARIVWDSVWA